MSVERFPVYEVSFCLLVNYQAHSVSNIGTNGSNRLLARRQLLADGTETDAWSGDIQKQEHAALTAGYLEESGDWLCPACTSGDSRRAGANLEDDTNASLGEPLRCGLCDLHGFLRTAKKQTPSSAGRKRQSKSSPISFSYALARPENFAESTQLNARRGNDEGEGQMIMKVPCRSGSYALCIRYEAYSIGVDTMSRRLLITDEAVRLIRHQSVLHALWDLVLSPSGAMTARMLPHLTGVSGAIVVRTGVGRAPMYSPLCADFLEQLKAISNQMSPSCQFLPFRDAAEFSEHMANLISSTIPYAPRRPELLNQGE